MSNINEPVRVDVAIVGGGLAGLTAGALLRRSGHSVLVLDVAEPGGRGRTDERDGVLFNRGPRALYLGGDAERVLTDLGVSLAGGPPSATGGALLGDRIDVLPTGAAALARTRLLNARGKVAIARFMKRLFRVEAHDLGHVTFRAWLEELDLPPDAAALVAMLSRVATYANAPDIASADMVVGQMQRSMRDGVRYLHGGWQAIVDTLRSAVATERRSVSSVSTDGAHVVVVSADGRRVIAKACIVAVGMPSAAASLLGRSPFDVGPAVEAACLDLATSARAEPGLLLGIDELLYLSNHCPPARLAPASRYVVHVARYLAPNEVIDAPAGRAELEAHAARVGLHAGVITDSRYLHRMTVAGALPVARNGGLGGRPAVDDTDLPAVFLAGDWVGPRGHLLDCVVASAEDAATRAARAVRATTMVS